MSISAPINPKSPKQMGKFPVSESGGDDFPDAAPRQSFRDATAIFRSGRIFRSMPAKAIRPWFPHPHIGKDQINRGILFKETIISSAFCAELCAVGIKDSAVSRG
jgi:hypothetical protein